MATRVWTTSAPPTKTAALGFAHPRAPDVRRHDEVPEEPTGQWHTRPAATTTESGFDYRVRSDMPPRAFPRSLTSSRSNAEPRAHRGHSPPKRSSGSYACERELAQHLVCQGRSGSVCRSSLTPTARRDERPRAASLEHSLEFYVVPAHECSPRDRRKLDPPATLARSWYFGALPPWRKPPEVPS